MKDIYKKYSPDELIITGLVISIFFSPYATVMAMMAIIGYLIFNNQLKNIVDSGSGVHYLLLFYVLTVLVSAANANFSGVLSAVNLAMIFLVFSYVRQVMTRSLFEVIVNTSCIASLFSFLVVLLQRFSHLNQDEFRVTSTFMNANYYAAITEIVVLFCVYRLLRAGVRNKPYVFLVMTCNLGGLYLSNCRSAFVALGVGILLLLLLNRRYIMLGWSLAGLGLLALGIIVFPDLFPRSGTLHTDLAYRASIWLTALKGILNHPAFGQGCGTYRLIYARYAGPMAMHAHSLILDPLLNFGLLGTLLLTMYLRLNLHAIRRLSHSDGDRQIAFMVYAILGSVVVHGFTDITFFSLQSGLLLILVLASAGIVESPVPVPVRLQPAPVLLMSGRQVTPRNRSL